METFTAPRAMREFARNRRRRGQRICVVPTMGFLHEGHLSLLRTGRSRSDLLLMTLFVNPTQFGPGEDLDRYPRDQTGDLEKAASCGVDAVFCPGVAEMYATDAQTRVSVGDLAQPLCGQARPGHFDGVATVVTKLFNITLPHLAIFGQKDYQQLAIIRRLVRDLDMDVEIVGVPTVRESDGLAMSSRNSYLSVKEREQATALHRGLCAAEELFAGGQTNAAELIDAARAVIDKAPLARIDYLELRDAETLETITSVARPAVLAVAAFFGKTRLIDNTVLS